jgi:hypothetical protein
VKVKFSAYRRGALEGLAGLAGLAAAGRAKGRGGEGRWKGAGAKIVR